MEEISVIQNDKANLEKMICCSRNMEGLTKRYDDICIRFYGDTRDNPGLLDHCEEQLLELGRLAGQFSEEFYMQHQNAQWKEMYSRMEQSIRKNGQVNAEAVWNEMDNCARWTKDFCEILRKSEEQISRDQPFLVLGKVDEETAAGMGNVEFLFAYLCVNAQGDHCIVTEEYIQYNRRDVPMGIRYLDKENLYAWKARILSPEETEEINSGKICTIDGKMYVLSGKLISEKMLPPFTPQIVKYYKGVFRGLS